MLKWYSNIHSRVSVQHTKSINLKSEIYDKHHGGGGGTNRGKTRKENIIHTNFKIILYHVH